MPVEAGCDGISMEMEETLLRFLDDRWAEAAASGHVPPATTSKVHIQHTPDAGRTLVLAADVQPSEVVLSVPPHALLNLKTIKEVFPRSLVPRPGPLVPYPLPTPAEPEPTPDDGEQDLVYQVQPGTVQSPTIPGPLSHPALVSLYLALCRQFPRDRLPAALRTFFPVVESMPSTLFTTHPLLVYLFAHRFAPAPNGATNFYVQLWNILLPRVQGLVEEVYRRFRADWVSVCAAYEHVPTSNALRDRLYSNLSVQERRRIPLPLLTKEVFVWAWLCVNTRCVFYELQLNPRQDNFTLMPMIDMANHTTDPTAMFAVHYTVRGGLELRAPPASDVQGDGSHFRGLRQGDPVCLQYGPHGNALLYAEYGFALTRSPLEGWNKYNDVSLDAALDTYIEQLASEWKMEPNDPIHPRAVLEEAGYWHDWTIQQQPSPPHLSWRTTMVLWCLSCYDPSRDRITTKLHLAKWNKAVSGLVRSAGDSQRAAQILRHALRTAQRISADGQPLAVADKLRSDLQEGSSSASAILDLAITLIKEDQAMIQALLDRVETLAQESQPHWDSLWDA